MKFGFGLEIAESTMDVQPALEEIEQSLKDCFAEKNYGSGVEEVVLGVTAVPKELYKQLPVRVPKYYRGRNQVTKDGFVMNFDNLLEIYVRPEVEAIEGFSKREVSNALAAALGGLVTALDVLKIENFAADAFAHDLERILLGMGQNSTKGELKEIKGGIKGDGGGIKGDGGN